MSRCAHGTTHTQPCYACDVGHPDAWYRRTRAYRAPWRPMALGPNTNEPTNGRIRVSMFGSDMTKYIALAYVNGEKNANAPTGKHAYLATWPNREEPLSPWSQQP